MKMPEDINTPEGRKKWLKGKKIMFSCCLCNKGMKTPEIYILIIKTNQQYWAHKKCLYNELTKEMKECLQ